MQPNSPSIVQGSRALEAAFQELCERFHLCISPEGQGLPVGDRLLLLDDARDKVKALLNRTNRLRADLGRALITKELKHENHYSSKK